MSANAHIKKIPRIKISSRRASLVLFFFKTNFLLGDRCDATFYYNPTTDYLAISFLNSSTMGTCSGSTPYIFAL